MYFDDLRGCVQKIEEAGELKRVDGADINVEIGVLTEIMARRRGPTLLFDNIKGYPAGYRVLTNLVLTERRQRIAFGFPEDIRASEIIRYVREKLNSFKPIPPVEVKSGPVMENVLTGDAIDIWKFPVPKWHEGDGGHYIGTGDICITADRDEGWTNCGTYRVMIHDSKTLSFYVSPGKHADLMRRKYWDRGEDAPVVYCFGQEPLLYACSTMSIPWGISEFEFTGYLKGRPIEVIKGPITGLPIPATSEIAIEGFAPPPSVDSRKEGPFGEWTGHYGSGAHKKEPLINIKAVYHRNDPILNAHTGGVLQAWYPIPIHTAAPLWNMLETAGIKGIRGVYVHGPGGRVVPVVSIKQMFPGHARQVGLLTAGLLSGGAHVGKITIVVDDDIDPGDWDDVIKAITLRSEIADSTMFVRGMLTSPLDVSLTPEDRAKGNFTASKMIIDACKTYYRMKDYPAEWIASDERRKKVIDKFSHILT